MERLDPERNMTDAERAEHWHRLGNPERNAATVVPTPGAMKAAEMIALRFIVGSSEPCPDAALVMYQAEVEQVAQMIDAALGLPEVIEALERAQELVRLVTVRQAIKTGALARLKGEK